MIDRLSGTLVAIDPGVVVLDVGGVGFSLHVPWLPEAQPGDKCSFFTHFALGQSLQPRLYGFEHMPAKRFFLLLCSVSGVGPKAAMSIMALRPISSLVEAVSAGQPQLLRAKGVGSKTTERIVLELKKKVEGFWD